MLGGLVLVGALLRLPLLGRAYWIDEGISVGIASHRLSRIPGLLRLDGSPPLYYVLLHLWLRAFGPSEVSTHTMTLLLSLALVPLAWWSANQLFGRPAGACAAALAATSPFLSWYGTETRMYPLVACMALVALTLTGRWLQRGAARDAAGALVAFALLLYTHDWALHLVVATAVVLILRALRRGDRREAARVVCGVAILGVAYLPWLPTFLAQARHTAAPWAVRPAAGHLIADPALMFGGTAAVVIGPLLGLGALWTRSALKGTASRSITRVLALVGGLTVLQGWVAAQLEPSWASRYLTIAFPALLLAAVGVLSASRRGRQVVMAAVVSVAAWGAVGLFLPNPNARFAKSNVAAITSDAKPLLRPGDLVVVTQTEQLAVVRHYLSPGLQYATTLGVVRDATVVDWRDLVRRLQTVDPCATLGPALASLPTGAHVFVVNPYESLGAPGTKWSIAVNSEVATVNGLMFSDPALAFVGSFTRADDHPEPFSPVVGLLFEKTSKRSPCSRVLAAVEHGATRTLT